MPDAHITNLLIVVAVGFLPALALGVCRRVRLPARCGGRGLAAAALLHERREFARQRQAIIMADVPFRCPPRIRRLAASEYHAEAASPRPVVLPGR